MATALLSLLAYALLGVVLSTSRPKTLPPLAAAFVAIAPTLIALVNATALAALLAGWRAVRRGRIGRHRALMLLASACITAFLILYVTRVALGGVKSFAGPEAVRTYVYLPVLTVHVVLSIVSVPFVLHNLLVGLTVPVAEIFRTGHPRVGRWAVGLWSISLALGLVVYLLLNVLY